MYISVLHLGSRGLARAEPFLGLCRESSSTRLASSTAAMRAAMAALVERAVDTNQKCVLPNGEEIYGVDAETGWVQPWLWKEIDGAERMRLYELTQEMLRNRPPQSPETSPGGESPTYEAWTAAHDDEAQRWQEWQDWKDQEEASAYNVELRAKEDLSLHDVAVRCDALTTKHGELQAVVEKLMQTIDEKDATIQVLQTKLNKLENAQLDKREAVRIALRTMVEIDTPAEPEVTRGSASQAEPTATLQGGSASHAEPDAEGGSAAQAEPEQDR